MAQSLLVWGFFVIPFVSSGSALTGGSSHVSRSSSSSNYILFLASSVLCLLAFPFLLGSAADYRQHKPTTIPFQYGGGA